VFGKAATLVGVGVAAVVAVLAAGVVGVVVDVGVTVLEDAVVATSHPTLRAVLVLLSLPALPLDAPPPLVLPEVVALPLVLL
jgi:hypothetical protein